MVLAVATLLPEYRLHAFAAVSLRLTQQAFSNRRRFTPIQIKGSGSRLATVGALICMKAEAYALSCRAATEGSTLPSSSSSDAPPPVEI